MIPLYKYSVAFHLIILYSNQADNKTYLASLDNESKNLEEFKYNIKELLHTNDTIDYIKNTSSQVVLIKKSILQNICI